MSSIRNITASTAVPDDLAKRLGPSGVNEILLILWQGYHDIIADPNITITENTEEDDITQEWYGKISLRWTAENRATLQYRADDVVRLFTETFHKRYGVECSAALHHNKKKTNYHIHLIFSERKMLEYPEVKIVTRNMFYDEQGKHRRTKREILDEQGNIRVGCSIYPQGGNL